MQIDVNGKISRDASRSDLSRAFAGRPPKGDWSITLESADGSYLQAFAPAGGQYMLTARKGEVQTDGKAELDGTAAEKVLGQFLAGDAGWRDAMGDAPSSSGGQGGFLLDLLGAGDQSSQIEPSRLTPAPPQSPVRVGIGCLSILAVAVLIYLAVTRGTAFMAQHFPNSNNPRLALLVGGMGAFALVFGIVTGIVAVRARSWPEAWGEVTLAKVVKRQDSIGSGGDVTHRTMYEPRVEYQFTVEGREYRANQIKLQMRASGREAWANGVIKRYPQGGRVLVRYKASDPGIAYLEHSYMPVIIAFALAVVFIPVAAHQAGVF